MQTKLTYRNGNLNDLSQIKELMLLAYLQYKNEISKENVATWLESLRNETTYVELLKKASCFICVYESKIIGSAFLIPKGNPYKWFQSDWAYIRLVAVHPDFEGKGIGKKLTQLCIEKATENDEKCIALHTSEFQNAARHIYESMGFVRIKELGLIFGKHYYLYTLQLK
jgi:ribosomal protein S18 acetylase RimI-like enzyme